MTTDSNNQIPKSLAARIAATMEARGVQRMFGVPGGGSSLDLIEAAADRGIEFVLCRTENAAGIMASVTGELTGIPGVVLTGIGPGAASAVNGVAYASLERAPIIVLTDAHDEGATTPPHQIFDQQSLFRPISKAQQRLTPADGATSFEQLFDLASSEPPGPVHIDLSSQDARTESLAPTLWESPGLPDPDPETIEMAIKRIAGAKKPVLVVGLQCRAADRAAAANHLATSLHGPVLTTYKAKGVFAEADPRNIGLYTGAKLDNTVLAEADLLIFCGVDPVEMIPGNWSHTAPALVISESPELSWPFSPDPILVGSVSKIADLLAGQPSKSEWSGEDFARHRSRLRDSVTNQAATGRSPDDIVDAVSNAAPQSARLAVDAGAHMFSAMTRWPANRPHDVLKSNGLSTMGYAVPAALASCLQEPTRPTIALTGDGGMMMSLAELSTAARLEANITVVVLNDAALSLIDIKQQRQQRPPLGVRYPQVDFATAARGMGCNSWKVGTQDPLEFALAEAFESQGPTLLDVSLDPSGYRDQLAALRG
ncbi:MAG: thiamine pyrophosphate-binding protein [Pseudomonadota bacterium]|nr:thiamine pyrophosphate-binding protein [Pseudomonadota bacterium]